MYAESSSSLACYEWKYCGGVLFTFDNTQWNSRLCKSQFGNETTTLVESITNGNDTLAYSYDEVGNITTIKKNGNVIESYTYDSLNQLKTVTRGNDTWTYSYDQGGNITSVQKNGTTVKSYTYGDSSWKDLLTSYNGQTITYDGIGNPLTYRGGMSFTWSNGRKLSSVVKGTDSISYTYDMNGLRTSKTVNGTTTQYYWLNGILEGQKTGNEYIIFLYDENGDAYGMIVKNGNTENYYYYVFNVQGDVIGILDNSGTNVVEYTYDEWGSILSTTGTLATTIGQKNPIRYRGYYYDTETGFYSLQSRYYDPEICRFINADNPETTTADFENFAQYNLFVYCFNNPVKLFDETGTWPSWATKLAIGVGAIVIGAAVVAATAATGGAAAAFVGATIAGFKAAAVSGAIGAAVGAGTNAVSHRRSTGSWNGAGKAAIDGVVDGFASGFMTGGIMAGGSQILSSGYKVAANAGVPTGRNGGLSIGNKVRVLSPNHPQSYEAGGTLLKIGSKYKNIRLDVGSNSLFHMNIQLAKTANYHLPIGILGSGLWGGIFRD